VTPLIARIYPNGTADVNHFHAAGGMAFLVRELRGAGLVHDDIATVVSDGFSAYARDPILQDGKLAWRDAPEKSADETVLRGAASPFNAEGGLRLMCGGIGRAVTKVSAVSENNRVVEAPAAVFDSLDETLRAFKDGALDRDCVIVVRGQGPRGNGMPEL